uniref:Cell division control protein 45 homolog n=1 Tax=Strigamia maritima TaxID=126957 RepID=T1IT13_STRMM
MIVSDIKKGFYDDIHSQQNVHVFVSFDVDAVCAWKILQFLFRCCDVSYTIIPVKTAEDLKRAYDQNKEFVKRVILINCGANINVLDYLDPTDDPIFYILDSHRPIDLYNVYNENQVRLILKADDIIEAEKFPNLQDVFLINNDEEEDEEYGSDEDSPPKRKRFDEDALEKQREKRIWQEKRDEIMHDYLKYTYYGPSSAVIMFDIAWKLSLDNNELLWWAIIGLTEQYINNKIDSHEYVLECDSLQCHVARHNPRQENDALSIDCLKITFDRDLFLALYRHWSLHDSIRNTMHTACRFKLWTLKGEKKLYEFLADLGLPLAQVKQKYVSMDMHLRGNVKTWIEDKAEKYGLNQILFASFHVQQGFRNKFCAADIVYAVTALLESGDDKTAVECFYDAVDCLARSKSDILYKGLDSAKHQLSLIYRQVQTFIDSGQVISTGPFFYANIQEGAINAKYFSHTTCITQLAQFLLQAQTTLHARKTKKKHLPLVLSAPAAEDFICLVGIPPISGSSTKKGNSTKDDTTGNYDEKLNEMFNPMDITIVQMQELVKKMSRLTSELKYLSETNDSDEISEELLMAYRKEFDVKNSCIKELARHRDRPNLMHLVGVWESQVYLYSVKFNIETMLQEMNLR